MSEERNHPLTDAGKILFVVTLLLFAGLVYFAFIGIFQWLPEGRYPLFYLLAPIGMVTAILFFGVSWLLRRRGVATFASEVEEVRLAVEKKKANQPPVPTRGKGP